MDTKLVDSVVVDKRVLDKCINEYKNNFISFLSGDENTYLEPIYKKVKSRLDKDRWVVMLDDFVYDSQIKACWFGIMRNRKNFYKGYNSGDYTKKVLKDIKDLYKSNFNLDLPTQKELTNSLTKINSAPFSITNKRPYSTGDNIIFKHKNYIQGYDTDINYLRENSSGQAVPLLRLTSDNNFNINPREVFFRWIVLGLIPKDLKDDSEYMRVLKRFNQLNINIENYFNIKNITLKDSFVFENDEIVDKLINEDTIRADINPYNEKILSDTNQGHWSLWVDNNKLPNQIEMKLTDKLVARNPKSSIIDGTVGIDFGTKSTVVVYQKDDTKIYPMRIGTGNLTKTIKSSHYENPTFMEFNDITNFIKSYNQRDGRPFTKWQDLTISHTAFNSMTTSQSSDFNSFISELKQWAGDKNKKLKIVDKDKTILDLPPFMQLKDEVNPIEIYAYYLGLYINNQHNGIFLNYILSFPVTYEIEIRDKIVDSFYKGIKKSLPQELHNQPNEIDKLSVIKGSSEPSAYAIVALEEYGFDPIDDEKVFYGVFDFGGGTTDFDFGIYREANGKKERRYDYVIEHFGAGGDRYLGGENLLELLTFEIFKNNRDKLLEKEIQFILPPECDEFLGSETLISISQEAKINTKTLMEKLRPFWEGVEEEMSEFDKGEIKITLTDIHATQITNFPLAINKDEMTKILNNRIEKGVEGFFNSLRLAFENYEVALDDIKKINIFLSGNSSKSILVKEIFEQRVKKETNSFKKEQNIEDEIFKIFEPLGSSDDDLEKPTTKTGVAFGLIKSRKGGKILVIDHNIKENIKFKFYLGEERKGNFKVVIYRDDEYNQWIDFIDASEDTFEIFYSSQSIVTTNKTPINDNSIKKKILKIDKTDDEALVYIRTISPTEFEYVVALEEDIKTNIYLNEITKVKL